MRRALARARAPATVRCLDGNSLCMRLRTAAPRCLRAAVPELHALSRAAIRKLKKLQCLTAAYLRGRARVSFPPSHGKPVELSGPPLQSLRSRGPRAARA